MIDRKKYQAEYRKRKLAEDPGYYRRAYKVHYKENEKKCRAYAKEYYGERMTERSQYNHEYYKRRMEEDPEFADKRRKHNLEYYHKANKKGEKI